MMSLRNFIIITINLPKNIDLIKYILTPKIDSDMKKLYNRILLRNNYLYAHKEKYISLYRIHYRNYLIIKIKDKLVGYRLVNKNGMNYRYKRIRWYKYKNKGAKEILRIKFE